MLFFFDVEPARPELARTGPTRPDPARPGQAMTLFDGLFLEYVKRYELENFT